MILKYLSIKKIICLLWQFASFLILRYSLNEISI